MPRAQGMRPHTYWNAIDLGVPPLAGVPSRDQGSQKAATEQAKCEMSQPRVKRVILYEGLVEFRRHMSFYTLKGPGFAHARRAGATIIEQGSAK